MRGLPFMGLGFRVGFQTASYALKKLSLIPV